MEKSLLTYLEADEFAKEFLKLIIDLEQKNHKKRFSLNELLIILNDKNPNSIDNENHLKQKLFILINSKILKSVKNHIMLNIPCEIRKEILKL